MLNKTVGIHVDISRQVATPISLQGTAAATRVHGRRLSSAVEAHYGVDVISCGGHERAVIEQADALRSCAPSSPAPPKGLET